ncbi:MAG: TetR/AcrR family transcriptional regulator [Halanaerobium sp.]|nr:TetR/AcrR family transcriptional regulator [Halanaerobium sp.]
MDKKAIQERRMKNYFIEAAKAVVREEGLNNLTVKKVADRAGYAPGTLYNYFADLNHLLFYCIVEFMAECKGEILKVTAKARGGRDKLIRASQTYFQYFMSNPNIFQLVFLADMGEVPPELEEDINGLEVVLLLQDILRDCAAEQNIREEKMPVIENILSTSLHGVMLFFIKARTVLDEGAVFRLIEEEIDFLLGQDEEN